MNYEEFLSDYQAAEKAAKDAVKLVSKLEGAINKNTDSGDIKSAVKNVNALCEAIDAAKAALEAQKEALEAFDLESYITSGDFSSQLVDALESANVNVAGEFPIWEVFPYKLRIDAEASELYLDKKKLPSFRPQYIASMLSRNLEKIKKSAGSFNAASYINEIEAAYDLVLLKNSKLKPGCDVELRQIYAAMVPARFKSAYDMQTFTYDIAKLYNSAQTQDIQTKSGRSFRFGPSKMDKNNLRILDSNDREQFIGTISFS